MKRNGIRLKGHIGTFYIIKETEEYGRKIYLLESEIYGDDANHVVVDQECKILYSNEYNGFSDYEDALDSFLYRLKEKEGEEGKRSEFWGIRNVD